MLRTEAHDQVRRNARIASEHAQCIDAGGLQRQIITAGAVKATAEQVQLEVPIGDAIRTRSPR